jgi:hypothetical protein
MYRRSVSFQIPESVQITDASDHIKLIDIKAKIDKIKNEKNLTLFKKFMDENTSCVINECTTMPELRDKYKRYASNINTKNLENIYYTIKDNELLDYNKNFIIRNYSYCRGCNTRYRYGCCEKNNRNFRKNMKCIVNLKLN